MESQNNVHANTRTGVVRDSRNINSFHFKMLKMYLKVAGWFGEKEKKKHFHNISSSIRELKNENSKLKASFGTLEEVESSGKVIYYTYVAKFTVNANCCVRFQPYKSDSLINFAIVVADNALPEGRLNNGQIITHSVRHADRVLDAVFPNEENPTLLDGQSIFEGKPVYHNDIEIIDVKFHGIVEAIPSKIT